MSAVILVVQIILSIAIILAALRVWRGPTMANRVVALDLLTVLTVGVMAAEAVRTGQSALVDVAVVVGITAFIGTAAFSLLIDHEAKRQQNQEGEG